MEGKTIYILAAGASVKAGLPVGNGLFDEVINYIRTNLATNTFLKPEWIDYLEILKRHTNDFERAISVLELLASQWKSKMIDLHFFSQIFSFKLDGQNMHKIYKNIYALYWYIVGDWINTRFKVMNVGKIEYLSEFVKGGLTDCLDIFTLNYDDTIELAASHYKVKYSTGFEEHYSKATKSNMMFYTGNFLVDSCGINLYKLHGSIQWSASAFSTDQLYSDVFYEKTPSYSNMQSYAFPIIILGKNKLRADACYLDLFIRLKEKLKYATEIVIAGYSFQDHHINMILKEACVKKTGCTFYVVDPYAPEGRQLLKPQLIAGAYSQPGSLDYRNIFQHNRNNEVLVAKYKFEDFLHICATGGKLEVTKFSG